MFIFKTAERWFSGYGLPEQMYSAAPCSALQGQSRKRSGRFRWCGSIGTSCSIIMQQSLRFTRSPGIRSIISGLTMPCTIQRMVFRNVVRRMDFSNSCTRTRPMPSQCRHGRGDRCSIRSFRNGSATETGAMTRMGACRGAARRTECMTWEVI